MILWTVMPTELIFDTAGYQPCYEEVKMDGTSLLVERINATQCKIVRLLATDPMQFLRPELQPGSIVEYYPFIEALR
ncbi:hypothetical protein P22_2243 [Propionispora sp. 2/2-37]|uniref:YlzJ-like family protein n=1 Tax=Propionispora sp. 2/2-37 TaxID=1677858 RepID=UPI0006BB8CF9|nr:YlzJ-like family protein [Propionispora sp. 2/2-37]CUH96155.1 hypothetical protein P22_2243 [Propionispora sp. 2/2-37]